MIPATCPLPAPPAAARPAPRLAPPPPAAEALVGVPTVPRAVLQALPAWLTELRAFLLGRLADPIAAEDLAQEAGARLLATARAGTELRDPRAWLFRVARNLVVDRARRRREQHHGGGWADAVVDPRGLEEEHELLCGGRPVACGDLAALLPQLLAQLPSRDREVIEGYYLHGRDCARLGALVGLSPHAVRVRLYRARRRLRLRFVRHLGL